MSVSKRKGFAMIMAIFIVVLVAGAGALLMHQSGVTAKSVSDKYLQSQATLLAESATEFAIMRAQDVNTTDATQCLHQLNITVQDASGAAMFDANVTLRYSFLGAAPASCVAVDANMSDNTLKETMVLVDTTVTDHNLSTEPIRVFKRTWQRL